MQKVKIIGAYVKDVQPGIYKNVAVFDITSSYPNQIISCNISPEKRDIQAEKEIKRYLRMKGILNLDKVLTQGNLDRVLREVFFDLDFFEKNVTPILKDKGVCFTPNLTAYKTDELGRFPLIVKDAFDTRKLWKKLWEKLEFINGELEQNKMSKEEAIKEIEKILSETELPEQKKFLQELLSNFDKLSQFVDTAYMIQYALKVEINSFYGAFSNKNFMFFNKDDAQTITAMGQLCVRGVANYIEKQLNYEVKNIYSDTDSIFLKFNDNLDFETILEKYVNDKIPKIIDEYFERLSEALNLTSRRIFMECEVISDKTIFMAKKKYIMRLKWKEGVEYDISKSPFKYKIKGFDIVKSSTPEFVKEIFSEVIDLVMMEKTEKEMKEYLSNKFLEFIKQPIEEISTARQINGYEKYAFKSNPKLGQYALKIPIHVKGAVLYNFLIKELGLITDEIYEGDKIKYIYVKPNPWNSNVISFKNRLPKEIKELFKYDFETQFEKTVLQPLEPLFKAINYKSLLTDSFRVSQTSLALI